MLSQICIGFTQQGCDIGQVQGGLCEKRPRLPCSRPSQDKLAQQSPAARLVAAQ